jgi:uncharacterized cysteine cluster protein YcgN (CxxCxxCC family)
MRQAFWELPLASLTSQEWEALCDGCGQCCRHKVEDEDSGRVWPTNVGCKLLDLKSGQCSDYKHRRKSVPDCVQITPALAGTLPWLPKTCAYRLRAENKSLPEWHYLLSGDREAVHKAGISIRGKLISELVAGPIENHIAWDEGYDG